MASSWIMLIGDPYAILIDYFFFPPRLLVAWT